jgi:hypothetical protein
MVNLPAGELTVILIFAILVEMLVEYFVNPLLPSTSRFPPGAALPLWTTLPYARYAAAIAGVALAIYYQLDVLSMLFPQYVPDYVGMVLSGLVISRGANYVHDWIADPLVKQIAGS